ncbi:MAG: transposase family protein, partial [Candidatus Marinimicrobia bacterium]|nr:transposase family protein [Candidatus Neomarinimicrobiota bacterium]
MVVDQPWKRIGLDLMGPLPRTEQGYRHIMVIVDYFSKWVEAFPLRTKSSREIMGNFLEHVVSRFGVPEEILTDRANELNQGIAKQIYQELGVKKLTTTAYHPQTYGLVERYNAT